MISTHSNRSRRIAALAFVAPFALALSACGGDADADALEGEAIAAIPAPEGTSWTETVTVSDYGGYVLGNPDAPLKLVEYASHTCGACALFSAEGKPELREKYVSTGVVSIEQRNLVRDPIDLTIAALVRCGTEQNVHALSDQAWGALNDFFANVQANSAAYEAAGELPLDQRFVAIGEAAGLIDFFAARGISADQARACLADTAAIEAISDASSAQVQEFNLTGTPTFFLNGRPVDAGQWPALEPILQRAGAR